MNKASASFFQKKPHFRYLPVVMTIVIGLILSIGTYGALRGWEDHEIHMALHVSAENHISALKRGIGSGFIVLESIAAFYAASREVERHEFREFVKPLLKHHPSIQALEWIPRVEASQRLAYASAAHVDGFPEFTITERKAQGRMVPTSERKDYFPVYFVEPYQGNELALGFDVASNPIRREALERARDSGKMNATARVTLVQETDRQFGILIFVPAYRKGVAVDSVAHRRQYLKGFILGVFRIGDMIEQALGYIEPKGIDIRLSDLSAPADRRFLYYYQSRSDKKGTASSNIQESDQPSEPGYTRAIDVAGRKWLIDCIPTSDFVSSRKSLYPLGIPLFLLVCAALLANYFLANIRSREQLSKAYHDLQIEISEREHAENGLLLSEQQYRSVFENTGTAIGILEEDMTISRANTQLARLIGYPKEQLEGKMKWTKFAAAEDLEKMRRWEKEMAEKRLDVLCEKFLDSCPLYIRHVAVGDPVQEILKLIVKEEVDLVVMASRGSEGHFDVGSVTQKLLQCSTIPVVTIPVTSEA